ncbi:iron-containing redox enzyme family protein [Cellulomonas fengjieae]|uniref:iron-containing redox enzyme family protein n=1 Tax=Cellulomonas fengjieae TaxID=2819978 RepID=UPI001AAF7A98|nr:iron-containing redox enzyme family protein [Cellulomonas fengjieae]MBO3102915.1 iron-containing redox enzyme family protein [Cellulomonas fengjieae]
MKLPAPRGPLGASLTDLLVHPPTEVGVVDDDVLARWRGAAAVADPLTDDDFQLTLWTLYALHYQGFEGVDEAWEWNPDLLRLRLCLEQPFEAALRARVPVPEGAAPEREAVASALFAMTAPGPGPSVARYVAKSADAAQVEEFLIHRSLYTLMEADPHTWAIPRLSGAPKAALVEVQSDEYGGGRPDRMHSALFARTMRGAGLVDDYGYYVDRLPAVTIAALNLMSLLGLHRRLRGAIAGHLAAFEMTSSLPNRLYGDGFRRLGHDEGTTEYFDEHVEADAVHEQIAGRDLAGRLAEQEPELVADILFGAAACLYLDDLVGQHMLGAWSAGESSLRAS